MQTVIVTSTTQPSPQMTATRPVQGAEFNDNDPKYIIKCWHLKQWAYFIGGYDMIMFIIFVLRILYAVVAQSQNRAESVIGIVFVIGLAISLFIFLFRGLKQERPNLVLTYLIISWLWIIFWAAGAVLMIDVVSTGDPELVATFIFVSINVLFRFCLQILLHTTLNYLRDKQRHNFTGVVLSRPGVSVYHAPAAHTFIQTSYVTQNAPASTSYVYTSPVMPQPCMEEAPPAYTDVVKN